MNVGDVHTVVLSLAGPTPQVSNLRTNQKFTSTLTPALLVVKVSSTALISWEEVRGQDLTRSAFGYGVLDG